MRNQYAELLVADWAAFVSRVEVTLRATESPSRPAYVFRGQASADWDLRPSLARLLMDAGVNSETTALHIEDQLVLAFQRRAHEYLPATMQLPLLADRPSWLILMQHYGAPTRTLDWT